MRAIATVAALFGHRRKHLWERVRQYRVQAHIGDVDLLVLRIQRYTARLGQNVAELALNLPALCDIAVVGNFPEMPTNTPSGIGTEPLDPIRAYWTGRGSA